MAQEAGPVWKGHLRWWLFAFATALALALIFGAGSILVFGLKGEPGWIVLIPILLVVAIALWPIHMARLLWSGDLYRIIRASVTSLAFGLWFYLHLLFGSLLKGTLEPPKINPFRDLALLVLFFAGPIIIATTFERLAHRWIYRWLQSKAEVPSQS